jgi:hypothetical protein
MDKQVSEDQELVAQARIRAFEGMVITAMLADKAAPLFVTLRDHFTAILEAIDEKEENECRSRW